ncbi:hypothetical protein R1sor_004157 [Riccia sorocarpa]|uniref:Killer toxin Kp4 domain-containing protein n=1 Tax=Riccia sorocarpa TaxID=122646 RepID=A0ABD3H774_9MARC
MDDTKTKANQGVRNNCVILLKVAYMDTTMRVKALALLTILVLLSTATLSNAGFISICKGSALCQYASPNAISEINTQVQALNDANTYSNGQYIACSGNICAYLQNVSGTKTAAQIKGYLREIVGRGCSKCAILPTEPGNNVATGELTINAVA